jgi:hypothetical protein
MPQAKAAAAAPKRGRAERKPVTKTLRPRQRTKSILVDVIEDEALPSEKFLGETEEALAAASDKKAGGVKADYAGRGRRDYDDNAGLDRQKEFFSDLASEIKTKDKRGNKDDKAARKRSLGLYRRLVIKFVILVAVLGAAVAYFSFSKLTIAVSLKGETISDILLFKVSDPNVSVTAAAATATAAILQNDPRETVPGTIKEVSPSVTKTYAASGETYLGEEIAGRVRIINNYNKSQALVATTRLLSPDGKLFRIKNAVNVPAGGEVSVDIYADKPAAGLATGPTTFTIPGLWLGLQDKIYAKNDETFAFTKKVKKYITANDLEAAAKDIGETLINTAKAEAGGGQNWLYLTLASPAVTIDAKAGDQKDGFTAKAAGKIVAVAVDGEQALKLAAAKLNLIIPDDKELTSFKAENISYSLDNYDAASKTATVKAMFNGTMVLKSDAEVINPKQLINLSAEQIGTYLKGQPEIKDYELKFFPAFIKKAPSLVDRIKIEVNKD